MLILSFAQLIIKSEKAIKLKGKIQENEMKVEL